MKCNVLLIENKHSTLYKNAQHKITCGVFKKGLMKNEGFYIPENCRPLLFHSFLKTVPLYVVDAKTSTALMFSESTEIEKYVNNIIIGEDETGAIIRQKIKTPQYKINGNTIQLFPFSDALVGFKLNLLAKKEFYEMIGKQLQLGLMKTLIYMGAGYGLFRFAEYVVRLVILKQG